MNTATITKEVRYDQIAQVERTKWVVALSDGRTKRTATRREAREWCAEFGVEVVPSFEDVETEAQYLARLAERNDQGREYTWGERFIP